MFNWELYALNFSTSFLVLHCKCAPVQSILCMSPQLTNSSYGIDLY